MVGSSGIGLFVLSSFGNKKHRVCSLYRKYLPRDRKFYSGREKISN